MNEPSLQEKYEKAILHYHLTVEYVGYYTLPYLPGWSHYETLKDSNFHEHHEIEYAKHLAREEQKRREAEHEGCSVNEPCLYSRWICHRSCRDSQGRAHTHK